MDWFVFVCKKCGYYFFTEDDLKKYRIVKDDRAGTASPPFEGTGSNPSLKQRSGDKPNG